jgi:GntR family transcriptional regulator/MocR family aminotransferase
VRRVRGIYRRRRDRLSAALATELPELHVQGVAAGLHVFLQLPPKIDDRAVAEEARREGVHVEPLSRFTLAGAGSGLVIGYGRLHESAVEPAIAALAAVLRHF